MSSLLLNRFLDFVATHSWFAHAEKTLLAVSGGIDSVVMCNLFKQAQIPFAIAHCNFKLREADSDADEIFVRDLARKLDVKFYSAEFPIDTSKPGNIQEQARDLRYKWFNELSLKYNYQCIATAHHKDDEIETLFINLLRGSGIMGLKGIPVQNQKIIRPLLFATREEIENFANENHFEFRVDKSNKETKYLRNKIRNQLIPILNQIKPDAKERLNDSIHHIKENAIVYATVINEKFTEVTLINDGNYFIEINKLQALNPSHLFLIEFLKKFNFSIDTAELVFNNLNALPGKVFYSKTHRLLKDRNHLIISLHNSNIDEKILIEETDKEIQSPIKLSFEKQKRSKNFVIPNTAIIATLDYNKLNFPLKLRRWKVGDYFYPLGMTQKKKLSDYFTDEKFNLLDKENIWLLVNDNDEIIWLIGERIDNRYKITEETSEIYIVKLENES